MNYINLINTNKSDIKYEIFTFNDGEPHIKFIEELPHKDEYSVITRIINPTDLFILLQVGDILERHGIIYNIYVTYLMGMRMDRVMTFNEAFSLKIVANMLNTLHPNGIYINEPHSKRTIDLINNAYDGTKNMQHDEYIHNLDSIPNYNKYIICYPDKGAYERYKDMYRFAYNGYIVLEKTRDVNTGNITGMQIKETYIPVDSTNNDILIYDDLCDGGRTFIEAYKILHDQYPKKQIDIRITHMVNPMGLKNLKNTFDHVYITDSYADYKSHDNVTVFNCSID